MGHETDHLSVKAEYDRVGGSAQIHGIVGDRLKNRPKVRCRAAYDAQHLRSRCLLPQRFTQLVEQPGVLDGDDGLRGEALDQFNLFIRERPDFLTKEIKGPYQLGPPSALERRARSGYLPFRRQACTPNRYDRLARPAHPLFEPLVWLQLRVRAQCRERWGARDSAAALQINDGGAAPCSATARQASPFKEKEHAERDLTDAGCIRQHCIEDRLQLARVRY